MQSLDTDRELCPATMAISYIKAGQKCRACLRDLLIFGGRPSRSVPIRVTVSYFSSVLHRTQQSRDREGEGRVRLTAWGASGGRYRTRIRYRDCIINMF